jgi:hypothetical protein
VNDEIKKEEAVKSNYILDYYNFTKIFMDPILKMEKKELAAISSKDATCLTALE